MSQQIIDPETGEVTIVETVREMTAGEIAAPPAALFSLPIDITGHQVRTVGLVAAEIYRLPIGSKTGVAITARFLAFDAVNGAMRRVEVAISGKRLLAGIVQVGATTQLVSHADVGTTTWAITPSISGNDFVISVVGAVGRTVDWSLTGTVVLFGPEGLP